MPSALIRFFSNRPYNQRICLCPEGNEGMSEIKTDHLSKEDCATMLRILRSGVLKYADGGREPVSTQETEGTAEMSSSNG